MRPPRKNWALKISTLVVVTACFVVMGSGLLVAQNFKRILTLWGEDVQMTVYVSQGVSTEEKENIQNTIQKFSAVENISFITQDQAFTDFKTQMSGYAPDIVQDSDLLRLIPASFQVSLQTSLGARAQITALEKIAGALQGLPGVDEVSYGQEWISKYATLVSTIEIAIRSLGLVILAAALFVISNAIRASVASRKEEIVVLEMIGATSSMIRKPFLIEGALLGFLGSALALAFSFLIYLGIKKLLVSQLSFLQLSQHIQFLDIFYSLAFIISGILLGSFASYLCVRRLNDGYSGSQV